MMKYICTLLYTLIFIPLTLFAEQVYKSVDEEGNIIFSDKPVTDKSEIVDIKPAQSVNFKQEKQFNAGINKNSGKEKGNYQSFSISQPVNEQTIRDNQGKLIVVLNMQSALSPTHDISIEIDGVESAKGKNTTVEVSNINRGEHTVLAHVVDESGKKIISSESVTFYMHRASKLLRERQSKGNQTVTPLNPPSGKTAGTSPISPSPVNDSSPSTTPTP